MTIHLLPALTPPINNPGTGRWYGVYPATVSDNQDPDGQGRVRVVLPWAPDGSESYDAWARLATTMAGNARGTWFIPEIDDEVLVGFGAGSPDHPYVVGALWNGQDAAPEAIDSDNNIRAIVSRGDIRIVFDDHDGAEVLTLSTPGGRKVTLSDAGQTLRVEDPLGNSVELASSGITVQTSGKLSMSASTIDISASTITANVPMSTFSGVVKVDTLLATTVVSSAYTPGAGNVW
ncbi:phage baseplate assembly protein V [Nocardioides sp.]|uniref:phage baseplate assembly protein V n=1 Tax=Nocardioides sp. TaxID=35761 RepID=UPI002CC0A963|nr:phage baseplate assembly protein V [Nocardioides sp.]HXH78131.1 phage baseplate assembly protein V [Nocardioides sp.]